MLRKRYILLFIGLVLPAILLFADQAHSSPEVLLTTVGEKVLYSHGDEHYNWWTDEQGCPYVSSSSGITPLSEQELTFLRRRHLAKLPDYGISSWNGIVPVGEKTFPVVLVFSDLFSLDDKFGIPLKELYESVFNGRSGDDILSLCDIPGSVAQYWEDNSFGLFKPRFEIYLLESSVFKHPLEYYGEDSDNIKDKNSIELYEEAFGALRDEFGRSSLSKESSGAYSSFILICPGPSQSAYSYRTHLLWPSCYSNPSNISGCTFQTRLYASEYDTVMYPNIGSTCHEFAHALGLPDAYDTSYSTFGKSKNTPGHYSLMDSGSHSRYGTRPPYLTCVEREMLWGSLSEYGQTNIAHELISYSVNSLPYLSDGYYVKIENPFNQGEYLYMESRSGKVWDSQVGSHLVLYHVDKSENIIPENPSLTASKLWKYGTSINSYASHPCYTVYSAISGSYLSLLDYEERSWGLALTDISIAEDGILFFLFGGPRNVPQLTSSVSCVFRVLDSMSGEPVKNVSIALPYSLRLATVDSDGSVYIISQCDLKTVFTLSCLGYRDEKISFGSFSVSGKEDILFGEIIMHPEDEPFYVSISLCKGESSFQENYISSPKFRISQSVPVSVFGQDNLGSAVVSMKFPSDKLLLNSGTYDFFVYVDGVLVFDRARLFSHEVLPKESDLLFYLPSSNTGSVTFVMDVNTKKNFKLITANTDGIIPTATMETPEGTTRALNGYLPLSFKIWTNNKTMVVPSIDESVVLLDISPLPSGNYSLSISCLVDGNLLSLEKDVLSVHVNGNKISDTSSFPLPLSSNEICVLLSDGSKYTTWYVKQ